jgi:hypothetical protein
MQQGKSDVCVRNLSYGGTFGLIALITLLNIILYLSVEASIGFHRF